ncbi:MAG: pyridoxal phosphate-dependent aminotransferase [Bifidobacteriaceae bacterium]|nr:pyridoxal phosphate-dependent aminotransferase [Bifidobacteriaceae bacterium]
MVRLARRLRIDTPPNVVAATHAALEGEGQKLINLSDSNPTRHNLFDQHILEVVGQATKQAALYDPDPRGPLIARSALAHYFGGAPNEYWLTSSTSQAYAWLLRILADPGDCIAIPLPGYPLIEPIARLADLTVRPYASHYVEPDGWLLDAASLSRAIAGQENQPRTSSNPAALGTDQIIGHHPPAVGATQTIGHHPPAVATNQTVDCEQMARAVIVVNPGNPTGAYLAGSARQTLVEQCAQAGVALLADEVFHRFAVELSPPPASFHGETACVTFTLGGVSKLLAAPQLKLAWIHLSGPAEQTTLLSEALDQVADMFLPVNQAVAVALPELLSLAESSVQTTHRRLANNLATARRLLAAPHWRVRRCDGGWMVLVDYYGEQPATDHAELTVNLMRQAGLAVQPGWFYDLASPNVLAISLLPDEQDFSATLSRLAGFASQTA